MNQSQINQSWRIHWHRRLRQRLNSPHWGYLSFCYHVPASSNAVVLHRRSIRACPALLTSEAMVPLTVSLLWCSSFYLPDYPAEPPNSSFKEPLTVTQAALKAFTHERPDRPFRIYLRRRQKLTSCARIIRKGTLTARHQKALALPTNAIQGGGSSPAHSGARFLQ